MNREDMLGEIEGLRRRIAELEDIQVRLTKAEQALRESEARFRALSQHTFEAIFLTEEDVCIGQNFAAEKMFGYTTEEALGRPWPEWIAPEYRDIVTKNMRLDHVPPYEVTALRKNGTTFPCEIQEKMVNHQGRFIRATALRDMTERKKAEEALQESETKYRFLTNHASDLIWTVDLNLRTTFVSTSVEKVLGFTPEERMAQDVEDQLTPESLEFARKKLLEELQIEREQGIQEGKSVLVDLDARHKDGSIVCLQSAVAFIRDDKGDPIGLHGVSRDITELKRSQEALKESEERYRRIVETANEGVWGMDEHFRTAFVNQKMSRMLGYEPEEMVGRSVFSFMFEEDLPDHRELMARREQGESAIYERRFKCKDGGEAWMLVSAAPLRDQEGNFRGSFAMVTDITERKRMEEALKESEQKYRRIIENTHDVIYQADMEGRLMFASPSCEYLFGCRPEECVGRRLSEFYAFPEERARFLELLMERGSVTDFEAELLRNDGSHVWVSTNAVLLKDQKGRPIGVEGVTRDVTSRKKAEEALRESETKYRSLFERIGDAVAVYRAENEGEDFICVDFNRAGEEIDHISREKFIGHSVFEIFPRIKEFGLFEVLRRVWRTGEPQRFPVALYKDERVEGWRDNFVYKLPTGEIVTVYSDETDRKRAEEALRESEEKFSAAFRFAPMPMTMTSTEDGRCIDVNDTFLNTFGYARAEVLGKTAVELGFWTDADERSSRLEKIKTEGSVRNLELSGPTKQGSLRHGLLSAVTIHLRGRPVLLSSFNDITDRRKAEEALRESEYMLRSILVASPVGLVLTEDRLIKWANEEWEKMFAFEDESEYVGQPTSIMYMSEAQYLTARKAIYANLENGILGETYTEFMRREGVFFQGHLRSTYLDPSDPSKGTLSAVSDVTEIVRTERALVESEQRYRVLVEDSRDAVFLTTRDGTILDANQAFCDLFGYERNELGSLNAEQTYADPAHRKVYQEAIEKAGSVKDFPVQLRKKDGTFLEVLLTASVRYGDKGDILGYQGIIRDVTEQRLLEKQLLQAQKMEAVGTLAGGIAHDFNNLLQVVLGYSEVLLAEKQEDDEEYADVQKIFHAAKSGAELVQRLLMFSRKSESKPVPMNLNEKIGQVEKLMRRTIPRMVDIHLETSPSLPEIHADPSQVEQVLMNLAVNACDAMPDGGKLTVRTSMVTLDEEYARRQVEASPGEYVLLEISDTGHGMDKETVEHIFEPFYTTKEMGRGTGLGLAMVHGIVKQHNGHVTVHSEVGTGTTFRVYLPAIGGDLETDLEASGTMPAFGEETVLLVEDEEFVRELGARILAKHGYTVLEAENGREALDLFKKEKSRISLVILDLIMPGMGGRECLKGLLKIDPNAKILVASGYSAGGSVKETIEMGAKGFVNKPFRVKELLRDVRRVLEEG